MHGEEFVVCFFFPSGFDVSNWLHFLQFAQNMHYVVIVGIVV